AQRGTGDRRTKRTAPQWPPGRGVERLDLIAFGRGENNASAGAGLAPIKRLRIKVTGELGLESSDQMRAARPLLGECRHDEVSAAVWGAMVGEDRSIVRGMGQTDGADGNCEGENQCGLYHGSISLCLFFLQRTRPPFSFSGLGPP